MSRSIAVIGGGIAGLSAAYELVRRGDRVTLIEERLRLGGVIAAVDLAGHRVEAGPDSFLARGPRALDLCRELGLEGDLVRAADFGAWIPRGGRLRRVPEGSPFGIPTRPWAAARTGALGVAAAARAWAETATGRRLRGPDPAAGAFLRARLGAGAFEALVDPLLAGTRAGPPDDLSLAAALPEVDRVARGSRSLLLGLRRAGRAAGPGPGPVFVAPRGGLSALVDRLGEALGGAEIVLGRAARGLRAVAGGVAVDLGDRIVERDAAVVAVPGPRAAALLEAAAPVASRALSGIPYASGIVVPLAFERAAFDPPGGSGLLVPRREAATIAGVTWYTHKWPHTAPDGETVVLRAFVGRGPGRELQGAGDAEIVEAVRTDLARLLGVRADPAAQVVIRWPETMPCYTLGHLERVERAESALARLPVALAGAALRGSGIPDCIESGLRAAELVANGAPRGGG